MRASLTRGPRELALQTGEILAFLPYRFCLLRRLAFQLLALENTSDKLRGSRELGLQTQKLFRRRRLRGAGLAHRLDITPPEENV